MSFRPARRDQRGTSLIEAMVAMAVIAIFMAGAFGLNSQALMLMRATDNASEVEGCVRDRLEKMRNAPWDRMVESTYIRDTVMSSTGNVFPNLPITLNVTVSACRQISANASPTPTVISVTRSTDGTASIDMAGDGQMVNEDAVKVQFTGTWSAFKKTRIHQAYTVVANRGISGRNK